MRSWIFVSAVFLWLSTGQGAVANSHTERDAAEAALDNLGAVTDQLTTSNMQNAVVPFAGTNTDEASMSPADFNRAILDIRAGSGQDGRAYQSTLDSLSDRPVVDLGSDPLALADDAIEGADGALGGLFSANSGTCDAMFQNGSYSGLRFCKAILQRDIRVCEVWREISVDREDFWACEMAERDYTRVCTPNISWVCSGSTGATCRRDRIRSNRSFTWANYNQEMRFTLGRDRAPSVCQIHQQRIVIDAYAGFDIERFRAIRWNFHGIGQMRVNGENVWTTGTTSRGNLNIVYVDSGGKDGVPALLPMVRAGRTPIDYCPYEPPRSSLPSSVYLLSTIDVPVPGPSRISAANRPYIPMGEHEEIVIDLLVASWSERVQSFRLDVRGSCCSQFSAVGGETC